MCRVRAAIVVEYDMLLLSTALDDFGGARLQLSLDLLDNGEDVGRDDRKYKHVDLLLNLLNQIRDDRNLLDGLVDGFDEVIVPFQDRQNLLVNLVQVTSPFFRFTGRDILVVLLGILRLSFEVIHFVRFLITAATDQAFRDLAEQVL